MPQFTTNDHVSLHYYDMGEGTPIILIPGYGSPADDWALQWKTLVDAGFRVISLDRRWHGQSERPPFGHRMSRHGKDVDDLIHHLGLEKVILVGHSMGGSTVWSYISLFGCDRLAGVVTVDQSPKMTNSTDWQHGFYGLTWENLGTFFNDLSKAFATGHNHPWPDPQKLDAQIKQAGGKGAIYGMLPETFPLLLDHASQDWRDVAQQCTVPALIIAGAESQFWPSHHAQMTAELNPLFESAVVPDAGHTTHIDQPAIVNALLLAFLSKLKQR